MNGVAAAVGASSAAAVLVHIPAVVVALLVAAALQLPAPLFFVAWPPLPASLPLRRSFVGTAIRILETAQPLLPSPPMVHLPALTVLICRAFSCLRMSSSDFHCQALSASLLASSLCSSLTLGVLKVVSPPQASASAGSERRAGRQGALPLVLLQSAVLLSSIRLPCPAPLPSPGPLPLSAARASS